MQDTTPIACTLTETDLRDRRTAWLKVGAFGQGVEEVLGGLRFSFSTVRGVRESLAELVGLEAECCAWMNLRLIATSERVELTVTGEGPDGEAAIRETFGPLSLEISRRQRRGARQ